MPESVAEPVVVTSTEPQNQTEVFAVHGADPEVLAYAMAKYSRSSLSMKDSLKEISNQRAEQFLNTFYFQYGHRSIADLAHIAFAIERLSLLAAISLVDEQRWDGQERTTRYQNFKKSSWYMPDFGTDGDAAQLYRESVEGLFTAYHELAEGMFASLKTQVAKPSEMKQESYDRTLRARAFDVARYLLPLATNTSLGQIVNARTLETQVSRLLSSPYAEIRQLGERLRDAAMGAAWNVHGEELARLQNEIAALDPALGAKAEALLTREVKTAPTLVKYAAPNNYEIETKRELAQAAAELMSGEAIEPASVVDLVERTESLEAEIATTLLYRACHYSYRQLRNRVTALDEAPHPRSSLLWARATAASTTSCCANSPPDRACDSTSSWTSAASATCTVTAAAYRSSRATPLPTATTSLKASSKPDCNRNTKLQCSPHTKSTQSWELNPPTTSCRWAPTCAPSSKWTSLKPSTSPSCVPSRRVTSPTAASPGRCTKRSGNSTRRWRSISV